MCSTVRILIDGSSRHGKHASRYRTVELLAVVIVLFVDVYGLCRLVVHRQKRGFVGVFHKSILVFGREIRLCYLAIEILASMVMVHAGLRVLQGHDVVF